MLDADAALRSRCIRRTWPEDQAKRRNRSMAVHCTVARLVIETLRQPSRRRVLRGVVEGVAEEARTRGFPSLPFGGFGFVGVACDLSIVAG